MGIDLRLQHPHFGGTLLLLRFHQQGVFFFQCGDAAANLRRHIVERTPQHTQLVGARQVDGGGVVPRRDLLGCLGQAADGAGDFPRNQRGKQQAERHNTQ